MTDVALFTQMLRSRTPFSFVKFGDGELFCMNGRTGENTDGHRYTAELGKKLSAAFSYLAPREDVYIATWPDSYDTGAIRNPVPDYDCLLLHRRDAELREFYQAVIEDRRYKIFVGPERLHEGVIDLLRCHFYQEIPQINAFEDYALVRRNLLNSLSSIFLFCAGMPGKVWIADLLQHLPGITCIDLGSAMDPVFFGRTRSGQPSMEEARAFFGLPELVEQ